MSDRHHGVLQCGIYIGERLLVLILKYAVLRRTTVGRQFPLFPLLDTWFRQYYFHQFFIITGVSVLVCCCVLVKHDGQDVSLQFAWLK